MDRGIVDKAVSEAFEDDELRDAALQQGRKRWAALERETDPGSSPGQALRKRKKRVMDFLVRRGFDYGLARDVVEIVVEDWYAL